MAQSGFRGRPRIYSGVAAVSLGLWSLGALSVAAAMATALLGTFVAYQSYRGYRRNGSRPMLFLAAGIALLTVVPFVLRTVVVRTGFASTTGGALVSQTAGLVGIVVLLYALTRA
ncbi:hypothetical protein VB779_01800 [Haloarculaceae archaeon H-GB11]|nr:hypothetical protein [Haloarculaceae archaeon H-GB11]